MTEPLGIDAQAISRRAHELWLKRGCPTGTPELDWLEAERELRAEAQPSAEALRDPRPVELASPDAGAERPRPEAARESRSAITTRAVPSGDAAPLSKRPRAPRSIITRSGHAPAARLLLALVPEADLGRAAVGFERAARRR